MAGSSLYDALAKSVGDGIADIRQKVVEEAWFGRSVTAIEGPKWPEAREAEPAKDVEQERDQEMDLER